MLKTRLVTSLLLALVLATAACGRYIKNNDDPAGSGSSGSGDIFVSGSSTVEPISASNADKFGADHPETAIRVEGPGTGDGFEIFCSGESDISDASRPIKPEEVEKCEQAGIEFVELKVAIDGLSVVTSFKNNLIECLSFADIYALIGPESIGFDNWSDANELARELAKELDPSEFGEVRAPYPNVPLVVTAPGEESGTFDSFVELVVEKIAEERGQEDTLPRPDYQASPNDNVIIDGISGTKSSLGWVGFAFVEENKSQIKSLAVDGGSGCVDPTPDTIASGKFPIARDLFIYVNKQKAEAKPKVSEFVDFYLSDIGLETVREVGYVPLPEKAFAETRAAWDARRVGSVSGAS